MGGIENQACNGAADDSKEETNDTAQDHKTVTSVEENFERVMEDTPEGEKPEPVDEAGDQSKTSLVGSDPAQTSKSTFEPVLQNPSASTDSQMEVSNIEQISVTLEDATSDGDVTSTSISADLQLIDKQTNDNLVTVEAPAALEAPEAVGAAAFSDPVTMEAEACMAPKL